MVAFAGMRLTLPSLDDGGPEVRLRSASRTSSVAPSWGNPDHPTPKTIPIGATAPSREVASLLFEGLAAETATASTTTRTDHEVMMVVSAYSDAREPPLFTIDPAHTPALL